MAHPAAQSAISRFRVLGLATVAALVVAHVAAYVITDISMSNRFE